MTDVPPPPYDQLTDTGEHSYLGAIRTLSAQVAQLHLAEERRTAQAALLTRLWAVFGSLITAGALGLGGWVWSIQGDVQTVAHGVDRVAERLDEHRAQGGPLGHPESTIARTAVNEGRITANAEGVRRIESRLDGIEDKIDELLERSGRRNR